MTVVDPFRMITGPFRDCPSCGAPTFGVLSVYPTHLARRCELCGYPSGGERNEIEPLPRLTKRVLYLDQSYWSNLVHQANPTLDPAKHQASTAWASTLARLEALVAAQALICPTSGFHLDETMPTIHLAALSESLDRLQGRLSGGVGFPDGLDIDIAQLRTYARAWRDSTDLDDIGLPELRYHGDPHGWTPTLVVKPATSSFYAGIATDITADVQRHGAGLLQAFANWRTAAPFTRHAHFQFELGENGPAILRGVRDGAWKSLLRFRAVAHELAPERADDEAGMPQAIEFFASDAVQQVPRAQLSGAIYAVIAYDANTGGLTSIKPSTDMDLRIVAHLAPYCDAITVDRQFGSLLGKPPARLVLDRYATTIIASRDALNRYLDDAAAGVTDAHLRRVASVYGDEAVDRFRSVFGGER